MKPISIALTISALGLAACAPAPVTEPISDQNYGGKYGSSASHTVTRSSRGCPDWANVMHRGDMYCLANN